MRSHRGDLMSHLSRWEFRWGWDRCCSQFRLRHGSGASRRGRRASLSCNAHRQFRPTVQDHSRNSAPGTADNQHGERAEYWQHWPLFDHSTRVWRSRIRFHFQNCRYDILYGYVLGNVLFIPLFVLTLLTYRFGDYYFVCAIGDQHDGHLPFWLPGFIKLIMLKLYVLFALLK